MKTNVGVYLLGTTQCSNDFWFDADGCFSYCNEVFKDMDKENASFISSHQANKLINTSTRLSSKKLTNEVNWYENKENFKDVNIDFEIDQTYNDGN